METKRKTHTEMKARKNNPLFTKVEKADAEGKEIYGFFAVQATVDNGEKFLCWKEDKHLYFAQRTKGYKNPPAPTLFRSKKEANSALNNIPKKDGNLSQFNQVLECKKAKIVEV